MAVRELPTGTVTLLFTDIEGSTRLMEELGEHDYAQALAEHRRLLRSAFTAHGGVEVDTQGDAFLYAFADPAEALAAAEEGQEALSSGPVSVRMGLHTGDLLLTGEGYAGRELHRAARIAASGHGGQVVVSAATRALVDGELTELGEHRLKDFDQPVPIFQLGAERFPPLKTISNTNLPRPASSFVGRQRERDELVSMLSNGTRLVTLSGPGGTGKTRLGVEVASELVPGFAAGVYWVGLARLRDPALVGETIAQTLGAKEDLAEHVGERELLLLLDNFEQVVDAAPDLGQLLERCPNLKLLVTSRELLHIHGEVDYPVPPLAEPEAVELFCTRSGLEPDATIAELCRRLDDLPLALELAASRTRIMSPAQILERLSERLDLLKGGRDTDVRQQTLRATIEWSHDLLGPGEKALFARLVVFRGGCTLAAAEEVAAADLDSLQSLVDKSLVRYTDERFWMLETIREYARERLAASGEEAELRRRCAFFFLDLAESAWRNVEEGGDLGELFSRFVGEHENLRASLEWLRDADEDEALLRLVAAVGQQFLNEGLYREMIMWTSVALERAPEPVKARLTVLRLATYGNDDVGDFARTDAVHAEWCRLAEETGNEQEVLRAMNSAALTALERGDVNEARDQFTTVREQAQAIGDDMMIAFTTVNLGEAALLAGDFEVGLAYAAEAVELFRDGADDVGVGTSLLAQGLCAFALSDLGRAEGSFGEALTIAARVSWKRGIVKGASGVAAVLIAQNEAERGVQLLAAAESLREELGIGVELEQIQVRPLTDAKAALGEATFAAAWARGEGMTPEEIVAFAQAG